MRDRTPEGIFFGLVLSLFSFRKEKRGVLFSEKYTFLDFILLTAIYIFGIINAGIMSFFVGFLRIFS